MPGVELFFDDLAVIHLVRAALSFIVIRALPFGVTPTSKRPLQIGTVDAANVGRRMGDAMRARHDSGSNSGRTESSRAACNVAIVHLCGGDARGDAGATERTPFA